MGSQSGAYQNLYAATIKDGRHGDVTRMKSKGVKYIIKVL